MVQSCELPRTLVNEMLQVMTPPRSLGCKEAVNVKAVVESEGCPFYC